MNKKTKRTCFLGRVAIFALACVNAWGAPLENVDVQLNLSLYGKGVDEAFNRGQRFGSEVEAWVTHAFNPVFGFYGRLKLNAEVGGNVAAFTQEYSPKREITLREARLSWTPLPEVDIRAGALDQDSWGGKIFLDGQAFPGLSQTLRLNHSGFFVAASAQQAVASTPVVTLGTPVPDEGMALFFVERLSLGWESKNAAVQLYGAHFAFEGFPASTAFQSRYFGSTVDGISNINARFRYSFRGLTAGLSARWRESAWLQPELVVSAVRNLEMTGDSGNSYLAQISNRFELGNSVHLVPYFFVFQTGADASPSMYTSADLGHSNRRGFAAGLDLKLPPDRIEIGAQAVRAPTVLANPFQADWTSFQLYFKKSYDVF